MVAATVIEYTDAACPFAWSAEPTRRRLSWLYGDALRFRAVMVGLSATREEYEEKGFTPAMMAGSFVRLAAQHGMPMDTRERPRMFATLPACRAVVAARLHAPEAERPLLRRLRVHHFAGDLLDEPETLAGAAREAGLDPADLEAWMADPEVEAALQADLDEARAPSAAALALDHKLAAAGDGRRYTCPSYVVEREQDGARLEAPGFQPVEVSEALIANLLPGAERRETPSDVAEVLAWAGEPLATQEVAAVCEVDRDEAREQLGRVADEEHLGADGLWSLRSGA